MRVLRQSVVVFLSTLLVLIWQKTEFAQFTVQAIGFLIFLYIVAAAKNKWRVSIGGEFGIFVLNSVILLLIFQTGGLSSPLFDPIGSHPCLDGGEAFLIFCITKD